MLKTSFSPALKSWKYSVNVVAPSSTFTLSTCWPFLSTRVNPSWLRIFSGKAPLQPAPPAAVSNKVASLRLSVNWVSWVPAAPPV